MQTSRTRSPLPLRCPGQSHPMPSPHRPIVCASGRPAMQSGGKPIVADTDGAAGCVCDGCPSYYFVEPCGTIDGTSNCGGDPPYQWAWICSTAVSELCTLGPGVVIRWLGYCWRITSGEFDEPFGSDPAIIDPADIEYCEDGWDCPDCCGLPPGDQCCTNNQLCGLIDGPGVIRVNLAATAVVNSEFNHYCSDLGGCRNIKINFYNGAGTVNFDFFMNAACMMTEDQVKRRPTSCPRACTDDLISNNNWPEYHDAGFRIDLSGNGASADHPIGYDDPDRKYWNVGTARTVPGPYVAIDFDFQAKGVRNCAPQNLGHGWKGKGIISIGDPSLWFIQGQTVQSNPSPEDPDGDGIAEAQLTAQGSMNADQCGNVITLSFSTTRDIFYGGGTSSACDEIDVRETASYTATLTIPDRIGHCSEGARGDGKTVRMLGKDATFRGSRGPFRRGVRRRGGCGGCGGSSVVSDAVREDLGL